MDLQNLKEAFMGLIDQVRYDGKKFHEITDEKGNAAFLKLVIKYRSLEAQIIKYPQLLFFITRKGNVIVYNCPEELRQPIRDIDQLHRRDELTNQPNSNL